MKSVLTKLLTVKSIMTLSLTAVVCYNLAMGRGLDKDLLNIYLIVISFYFGVQSTKS